jgi:demethylmenaquinone methyltransferase/2-methoxy-6-polyprenyl-1,4-benzoquinol methylase
MGFNKKLYLKTLDFNNPENKKKFNNVLFNIVAPRYNFITKALSFGLDVLWKKKLIQYLPFQNHANCLDIACGTGDITKALSKKYKNGKILGLDISDNMLKIAKAKLKDENVTFLMGNMNETDLQSNSIDILTGGYALRNAPDLKATLEELYRIMSNDSTAGFLDFAKSSHKIIQKIQLFILKSWGNFWGLVLHGNPEIYGYIAESLKYFPDQKEFETLLKHTGFKVVKTQTLFFRVTQIIVVKKEILWN